MEHIRLKTHNRLSSAEALQRVCVCARAHVVTKPAVTYIWVIAGGGG